MTGAKFNEKFDGTGDFGLWRIKMRVLLIQHGCKAVLEVLPVDMEAEAKDEINKKAHSAVILCLGNKVLREVTEEMIAAEVWSKLDTLYMIKSLDNKLYLKKKLYTFYMSAGRKFSEHIDEFNKIVLDLANIEVKFKDKDLALLSPTSLPSSYEHFVDTLLYGRKALTLEDVMATLNSKKIKERDSHQSRGKSSSKSRGGRLKCYICQSEDHLKRNCSKNNHKKSISYVKKDDQPSSSGSIYDCSEVMMVMNAEALLDWIIDSRGSARSEVLARVVLSRTRRDNCVYSFDGHALAGELNASVEEKDSLAQVWHKKLRHISEAGLQVLEKQELFGKKSINSWVRLRFKHEAFVKFKEWKQLLENQTRRTAKKLRTDNGLEFCNWGFEQLCTESGIARHLTIFVLPKTFWKEATCTAGYLINRSPSTAIEKKTRMKMWSGHLGDYEMLRGVKGYRLYRLDDESPKIVTSRNVVFNESVMYKDTLKDSGACTNNFVEELHVEVELQGLNNHTLKEDHTDQEDGDDEDTGDQELD
ncbi:retrovirus-related pol polyprotein from transposon TNT 1-94 [Tanacetum coccineum]